MMHRRLLTAWTDYWFARDGRLSVGIARIAIGLSALWLYRGGLALGVPRRLAEAV